MLYIIQSILYRVNEVSALKLFNEVNDFINILPEWNEKPNEWLIAHPSKKVVAVTHSGITPEAREYIDDVIAKKSQ